MLEDSNRAILATGGYDHTIKLWQTNTGMCCWTGQHVESQINSLFISRDKRKLAAAGYQHVRLYDLNVDNANSIVNYEGISKNITCVGFQDDNKWMFTAGEDATVRIWDLRCRNIQCYRIFQTAAPVNYVTLHPNQSELIFCDDNGIVHIWNLRNDHNEKLVPETEGSVLCVAVDPAGSYLSCVSNRGYCHIWDLPKNSALINGILPKESILAHDKQVLKCKFSPDSKMLVTTSADQTARIWKLENLSLYRELKCPNGQRWVWDAAFTDDSQYVITVSSDGNGRLWNIQTGSIEREYTGHQKALVALAFRDSADV